MSSARLGAVVAAALAAAGVREVVVCPGSRNTPLAVALARSEAAGRLRVHTRTDERSGGFLALGLARAAGIAAVVVTSGTAVGNLMPAVMEARAAGVPLVVLTADRPATLVGSGANQTADQRGIFGVQVVADVQLTSTDDSPKAWSAAMRRAIGAALGVRTRHVGGVHVNLAFTEPFVHDGPSEDVEIPPLLIAASRPADPVVLPAGPRTVVLAGDASSAVGRRARDAAETAGVPLLAEPSSNARGGPCAVPRYREVLDGPLGTQIERVVLFGHPTLSRPVTRLLGREDVELVVVADRAWWPDPGFAADLVVDGVLPEPGGDAGWLGEWLASGAARSTGPGEAPITGPELAAAVVAAAEGNLVFGSSNPIRDADLAPVRPDDGPVCWANRGLSGIDGVISTGAGIALGTGRPTTVLLGDLGFLHDLGSLHVPARDIVPDLRVVVADDDGGSIFRTLEIAEDAPDLLERVFLMPHGRDLAALAAGFGWPAHRISSREELWARLAEPVRGIEVLVVGIDRTR